MDGRKPDFMNNKTQSSDPESRHPVALITGSAAAGRLGNAIAWHLAEQNYRLVIHANRSVEDAERCVNEMKERQIQAISQVADLTDEASVARMFADISEQYGEIDVLINCASIWERLGLWETTAEDVRRHFEVNTLATFLCCQAAGKKMVEQESGGVILNFGDWATIRPYRDYAAYFASKGSIETLTRDFAIELAHRNPRIRVNAVLPGPVTLPPDLPDEVQRDARATALLDTPGTPAHIVHAVMFLLENDLITGVCLPVDAGRSVFAPTDHWR